MTATSRISIKKEFKPGGKRVFLVYWGGELVHRCKRSTDAIRIAQALDEATQRGPTQTEELD